MLTPSTLPVRWANGFVRPRLIVFPSFLSLLVAGVLALGMWVDISSPDFCDVASVNRGANINHAVALVAVGSLAGAVVLLLASPWRWPLAIVTVLGAAALATGITLVALDSAYYFARLTGPGSMGGTCPRTWTRHLAYLDFFWGPPLLVLLLQTTRLIVGGSTAEERQN